MTMIVFFDRLPDAEVDHSHRLKRSYGKGKTIRDGYCDESVRLKDGSTLIFRSYLHYARIETFIKRPNGDIWYEGPAP